MSESDSENEDEHNVTNIHETLRRDPTFRTQKYHPTSKTIGNPQKGVQTHSKEVMSHQDMVKMVCMSSVCNQVHFICYLSQIKPENIKETLKDNFLIISIQEKLN